MNADSDYARIVELLSKQTLAPYVSYVRQSRVTGLAHEAEGGRIVVRLSDGKIVDGNASSGQDRSSSYGRHASNPVTKPAFYAACYRATGESLSAYGDASALEISLVSICSDDANNAFSTLYADPRSLRPLEVKGWAFDHEQLGRVKVALDERFALFDGRTMPAALRVDVTGSGMLFWVQAHVDETYSDYRFLQTF